MSIGKELAAETRKQNISGPGILWVASRIHRPDQISWPAFQQWNDDTLIPNLMSVPGVHAAVRATATEYALERPNAVISVTDDLSVFDGSSFKAMPEHRVLPDGKSDNPGEYIDYEARWYNFVDCFEHAKKPLSETRSFMTTGWDVTGDIRPGLLDQWWTTTHCEQLSKLPGFVRTTRYKAKHAWWSVGGGATLPCPDWFEIIEFDHPDVDILTIVEHPDSSEEGQEILEELLSSLSFEFGGFCVEKTWGRDFMFKPTFALKS